MSLFTDAMNAANTAFGAVAGEEFTIPTGVRVGIPGTYSAITVDDLKASSAVAPGGLSEGTILVVRSRRVRVVELIDEGDDTWLITCGPAGISVR